LTRSGTLVGSIYRRGGQVSPRESCPYSLAVKLLDKRRGEAIEGRKLPETLRRRVVTFGEITQDALAYSREHNRSYRDDCSRIKLLTESWGNHDVDSLNGFEMEQELCEAARKKKWAASTYNHYRSLLLMRSSIQPQGKNEPSARY
jgi:hypothetical protein